MRAAALPLDGLVQEREASPGVQRAIARLTMLGVLLLFGVSPMLLTHLGISYDTPAGSLIEKIHPGSWVLGLAFALHLFAPAGPWAFIDREAGRSLGALALLAAWCALLFQIIVVQKVPFTPIIDTFLMPVMVPLLCAALTAADRTRLAAALHVLMAVNALIGIGEVASGERLIPFYLAGAAFEGEWRATALLGHPLANACLTACYVLLISSAGTPGIPSWLRVPQILLQLAAMTVFGGRTALVGVLAVLVALFLWHGFRFASGKLRLDVRSIAACAAALPVLGLALAFAYEAGAFERLIDRFQNDEGSANTRLVMFDLLAAIPLDQLVIGPDQALVDTLKIVEGLELGIESFWVAFILRYGILASLIFFAALAWFIANVARQGGRATWLPLLFFFAIASTSVSLSAKTTLLGMFIAFLLILPARANVPQTGLARREGRN